MGPSRTEDRGGMFHRNTGWAGVTDERRAFPFLITQSLLLALTDGVVTDNLSALAAGVVAGLG